MQVIHIFHILRQVIHNKQIAKQMFLKLKKDIDFNVVRVYNVKDGYVYRAVYAFLRFSLRKRLDISPLKV